MLLYACAMPLCLPAYLYYIHHGALVYYHLTCKRKRKSLWEVVGREEEGQEPATMPAFPACLETLNLPAMPAVLCLPYHPILFMLFQVWL